MCGTTHKTARRVGERHNAGGPPPTRQGRGHNYDEVRGLVAKRVRKSQGRISAKKAAAGRQGGLWRVGAEFPAAGRGGEGGVAGRSSPRAPPGGVVAG
jgi:hypothetical protein